MSSLIIALDIGTSSVRAIAFDLQGKKQGQAAQIPYEQTTTTDGGVEVGADRLLNIAGLCLDALLKETEGKIEAVGISCFWHSLIAVDKHRKPLTGVLSWADNRAAGSVSRLKEMLDEKATHADTGCVFHSSYWPAKLLWLHSTRKELFNNETVWMGFGEYLALQWCGSAPMSISMASATGLFHQNAATWDDAVCHVLPIDTDRLPTIVPIQQQLPDLSHKLQKRWPQLVGVPWFPAVGDGACSNIGSGCANSTRVGLNAGTSGAMRIVLSDCTTAAPPGLWRYRVDHQRSIIGGAVSNVGNLFTWATERLNLPANWPAQVAALPPLANHLTVLPFLAGERSPLWNGDARLALTGASLDTTACEIMRSLFEGVALRFREVENLLRPLAPHAQIVFSGGALEKVEAWQQILCDAMGKSMQENKEAEASARGAALLASESARLIKDVAQVPSEWGTTLEPIRKHVSLYDDALKRQNELYQALYQ